MSHVTRHTSHVTRHTSHVTRHTSHVTRHTSHVKRHTSHVTPHTSHVTRHTSHVTRHTSHVTRHTSHVTRHTSHVTRHRSDALALVGLHHKTLIFSGITTLNPLCFLLTIRIHSRWLRPHRRCRQRLHFLRKIRVFAREKARETRSGAG